MAKWNKRMAGKVRHARETDRYWSEKIKLDFALAIHRFMERSGLTKTQLAERIGVSQPYITKALRGDANLTIETMVKLARAVGAELQIDLKCRKASQGWREAPAEARPSYGNWDKLDVRSANDLGMMVDEKDDNETLIAA